MATAGTSTDYSPIQANRAAIWGSTIVSESTGVITTMLDPGAFRITTGSDVIKLYALRPDGKMALSVHYRIADAADSYYGVCAVRMPPTSDKRAFRASNGIGTSTAESGWRLFVTTASVALATSQGARAVFGPFETANYGHKGASTGASGTFIEVMAYLSTIPGNIVQGTIAATTTVANFVDSTTLHFAAADLYAIEVP